MCTNYSDTLVSDVPLLSSSLSFQSSPNFQDMPSQDGPGKQTAVDRFFLLDYIVPLASYGALLLLFGPTVKL